MGHDDVCMNINLKEARMPKKESFMFMKAVEAAREYAQSLTDK